MAYQSFKDLDIYKKAHNLSIEIHAITLEMLPKFEMYEEGSQIRQSSKSVTTNIVEGFGRRRYKQDFIKFLTYALASCDETREHLNTLYESKSYKDEKGYRYFIEEYDHLGKMLTNFIKSVDIGHQSNTRIEDQASRIKE